MQKWKDKYRLATAVGSCFIFLFWSSCETPLEDRYIWKSLEVTTIAYNSERSQTLGNQIISAWGDSLKSGIRSIAVSRNIIALGLKHNTPVKIEGFDRIFFW